MIKTKPNADPNGLYGASEAAQLLQVSRPTIYRYLKGQIRKATGRKVFRGQDLLDFWEDSAFIEKKRANEATREQV